MHPVLLNLEKEDQKPAFKIFNRRCELAMKTYLKLFSQALLFCFLFLFLTCKKKGTLSPEPYQITTLSNNENIYSNQVWKANEIHIIKNIISINAAILRIEPGSTIKFEKNAGILVNYDAGLIADGSEKEIYFTSDTQEKGFWRYILFTKNSLDDSCKLINCVIEYSGGDTLNSGAIVCDNASPEISSCNINHTLHSGVILKGNCRGIALFNNTLSHCNGIPIQTNACNISFIGINTYTENNFNFLKITDDQINYNDTWYKQSIPFRVSKGLKIKNAELKITSGVELFFEQNQRLKIDSGGSIKADGTNEIIKFTSANSSGWEGIIFESSSDFTNSSLIHCYISDGGRNNSATSSANIVLKEAYPEISNCNIKNSNGYGVSLDGAFAPTSFINNQFSNNKSGAISISANAVSSLNPQNFGTDETNFILIRGGFQDGTIVVDGHWKNFNVPYKLQNSVQINSSTLTLDPAVHIIMSEMSGFEILNQAGLIADGQSSQITIEGEQQSTGYWKNIYFSQNAKIENCRLINCRIKNGGGDMNQPGMIYCDQNAPVIRNCYIENSGTWGIYVNGNFEIQDLNSNIFFNNALGDYNKSP